MSPPIYIHDNAKELLGVLGKYLPLSMPLLRRLQFMDFEGGKTASSRILASFENHPGSAFVVSYLDFSRGPETEMWIFSSIEDPALSLEDVQIGEKQIVALFSVAGDIEDEISLSRSAPGTVKLGSVHEKVLEVLRRNQLVERVTVPYRKFIFYTNSLSSEVFLPSEEFSWGSIREEHLALVLSRTEIPRKKETLILLPSAAIYTNDNGSPVAWGFLGPDGSLASLHCEKEFRGQGLAKAITLKLFREHLLKFGPERLAHADVALENSQSQGVCKSLGATDGWIVYWYTLIWRTYLTVS